ncbi:MAG: polysaccharide biosynthesis C-terminal domain-containing protein, partial [Thermoplasmata archaeon]|nr:polysaccharide biosynthesis C-terminal domain-containing protein [Thermoplasmata archaeon]
RMQYKKFSLVTACRSTVKLLLLFLLFYSVGIDRFNVLLVYAFGGWVAILGLEAIWPKGIRFRRRDVSGPVIKKILGFSSVVFASTLAYTLLNQSPMIALGIFKGSLDVALYAVPFTLTIAYGIVPIAILTIAMPKISHAKMEERALDIFHQSSLLILVTGVLLVAATVLMGRWLLTFLFTSMYEGSYIPLVILAVGSIFLGLRNAFGALWQGGGRPRLSAYDAVGGAVVAIVVALWLIPTYSVVGASLAYAFGWGTSVVISGCFWMRLKKGKLRLDYSSDRYPVSRRTKS